MSRVKGTCPGDCSRCELLEAGEVDMIPCVLDQIFQRLQKQEKDIDFLKQKASTERKVSFSGVEPIEESIPLPQSPTPPS